MEVEEILEGVFGPGILEPGHSKKKDEQKKPLRVPQLLALATDFVEANLAQYAQREKGDDNRPGRIGQNLVRFDISSYNGLFTVSPDRLSINSITNFSTMRANTGVYKGKWMYELQLGSKGVMQVGWGTTGCKFNQESGVGDTINSYAYDGNRVRKWNVTTHKYGEPWLTGDIIGCALDMDSGTIDFYRNGRHLGRAFENIAMGSGIAYFPTVSLAFTENLTANFGSTPLRYPVEGYEPLQAAPEKEIQEATLLLKWLQRVIELLDNINDITRTRETIIFLFEDKMSLQAFLLCLARIILKHLGPLLTIPYITEHVLVPFLQQISESKGRQAKAEQSDAKAQNFQLNICLDLLWTFLEDFEMKACLESTVLYLLSAFRHVSLLLEYPDQCKILILLTKICQHPITRQYFLQYLLFDRVRFANFIHVKPLDEGGLSDVVRNVWWETNPVDPAVDVNRASYLDACDRIKAAISEVEALQIELLVTLLDNTDGDGKRPASRTIFLRKFKRFIQQNFMSNRTPLPLTLCCFHRLLAAFRALWDAEIGMTPVYIPCRVFYDMSINYPRIDRLGGVLSHLYKTFQADLLQKLGPDHPLILSMVEIPVVIPTFTRMLNPTQGSSMIFERLGYVQREDRTPIKVESADSVISLLELLDGIIMFYHVSAKKQLAKVASLRDSMTEYISAMSSVKRRLEIARKEDTVESTHVQRELLRTIEVFNEKLGEQARHMAWIRAAVYSEEKQKQLAWLLRVVTLTLNKASEEGNLFSFVPDFYLEALADLCIGLRSHIHPTAPIEKISGYKEMFLDVAQFLCDHFLDPRIVHAIAKDTLIVTLAGFVSNPLTLEVLENVNEESRIKVVNSLLKPYENRAWAQSNWVLVRFWQGNGFAFRYEKSPHLSRKIGPKLLQQESISQPIKPCPSAVYQEHVRNALLNNAQATTKFLNSLMNQLNWAFSEFIGMVQEIHNVSSRPERVFIESRQLKICATCFDLAISLLRVLEMIVTVAPSLFNDSSQSSSENLLSRLCQLLCQVLNRMSSQTSCFQHVVLLEIPDLESVDHFPILAAVIGILLALLQEDISVYSSKTLTEVPRVTNTLLTEPSFQISSLYFVLGDTKPKSTKMKNVKPFSFLNYKEDVTEDEVRRVREMIEYLDYCRSILPDPKIITDDDNTCTICYAFPIAATFKPCNHQTCRMCIDRHLLNVRQCFFCTVTIEKVIDLSGKIIHDFTTEGQSNAADSPN